jgi:uncharacterized protein
MFMPFLILLFGLVALIYASVGFGGGSTYTALLALSGVDYKAIPVISLLCNIIVVTGGCVRYWRAGLIDWRAMAPLLLVSAPLAFLGGQMPIEQSVFYLILGGSLLLSAIALLVPVKHLPHRNIPLPVMMAASGAVGLLAGLSGIGGGIFMAPLLHLVRWAEALRIAAFASVYILINSIAGIAGQFSKAGAASMTSIAESYWPLMIAVFVGGQLGSYLGLRWLSPQYLRWLTALLVGYVALRLLLKGF